MKFTKNEQKAAASFGVSLGSSYASVRAELLHRGWIIDNDWLADESEDNVSNITDGLACGNGYDAVCWTRLCKNGAVADLTFSGSNEGLPLIDIKVSRDR